MIFGEESPLGSEPPRSGWPKRSKQTGRTTSNRDASRFAGESFECLRVQPRGKLMSELFLRFVIGGIVVSAFAILGDLFKPKSFAGLFGAAPSVALATLALTVASQGRSYAAIEARSMIAGAIAFFVYAFWVGWVMLR